MLSIMDDWQFERMDWARHHALTESRRRAGMRTWSVIIAVAVVLPIALGLALKGFTG